MGGNGGDKIDSEDDAVLVVLKKHFDELSCTQGAMIRLRTPFSLLPKHDVRGETIFVIVEHLSQRGMPLWACYHIAQSVADAYSNTLQSDRIPFAESVLETTDATSWYPQVFKSLNEYLMKMHNREIEVPKKLDSWNNIPYSHCSQRNMRTKMEDKDIILPTLSVFDTCDRDSLKNDSFFAIFDGHNGVDCAAYAGAHFVTCLLDEDYYAYDNMEELFVRGFDKFDARLQARCKVNRIRGGAATVCALLRQGKLCIAWCGDAAAAILCENSVKTLSKPHLPSDSQEARRVVEAGGVIVQMHGDLRVNGVLNITRSIGELEGRPMISSIPDTLSLDIDGSQYLLILACDGVWDTLTEQEVYDHIKNYVRASKASDFKGLGNYIVSRAKDAGSTDNLTFICAFLRPVADLWELFSANS